jgi:NADH:ubiquinone oxidoreductase subunit D/Ni,Fe-hydrogenase III component G
MQEETARAMSELEGALGAGEVRAEQSVDIPTLRIAPGRLLDALEALQTLPEAPFVSLLDLTWLNDERGPQLIYLLRALERDADLRLKVRLEEGREVESISGLFSNASVYEREVTEACGARFSGALCPERLPPHEEEPGPLYGESELAFVLALERLAGVVAPPRAQLIRVLRAELLRLASHFRWYGAFSRDLGACSAAFYADDDARRCLELAEEIAGAMPDRFTVGGVRQDLPRLWQSALADFLEEFEARLYDYTDRLLASGALQERTKGVSPLTGAEALAFGLTGPVLRASGVSWDLRARRPYAGYAALSLRVPVGLQGDCYDRAKVRLDEMHESLRILDRCAKQMPAGPTTANTPELPPAEEATALVESSRGEVICTLAQGPAGLRVHVRSPRSPHLQASACLREASDERDAPAIHGSLDPGVALP